VEGVLSQSVEGVYSRSRLKVFFTDQGLVNTQLLYLCSVTVEKQIVEWNILGNIVFEEGKVFRT
jgi:hypothetical protein